MDPHFQLEQEKFKKRLQALEEQGRRQMGTLHANNQALQLSQLNVGLQLNHLYQFQNQSLLLHQADINQNKEQELQLEIARSQIGESNEIGLQALREKYQALDLQQKRLQAIKREMREQEREKNRFQHEKEKIEKTLDQLKQAPPNAQQLKHYLKTLEEDQEKAQKSFEQSKNEEQGLTQLIANLKMEIAELKDQQKQTNSQIKELAQEQDNMHADIENLNQRLVELEKIEEKLRSEFKMELEAIEAEITELSTQAEKEGLASSYAPMLQELQEKYEAEKKKQASRSSLLEDDKNQQAKQFYLIVQERLNAILTANKVMSTGYVARGYKTRNFRDKIASKLGALKAVYLPFSMFLIGSLKWLLKLNRNIQEAEKAKERTKFFISVKEIETETEEIAFRLTQHYFPLLIEIHATGHKKVAGVVQLAEYAAERVINAIETLEEKEEYLDVLLKTFQTIEIKEHKKHLLALTDTPAQQKDASDTPYWRHNWTVEGFFSGAGIRTTTPRKRRFTHEKSEPLRYGYLEGDEAKAHTLGMREYQPS